MNHTNKLLALRKTLATPCCRHATVSRGLATSHCRTRAIFGAPQSLAVRRLISPQQHPNLFAAPATTSLSSNFFFSSVANHNEEQAGSETTTIPTKVIPFRLADIGEGIAEVELLQWYVAPGDTVAQFDRVCEVQSDKATVEITSRYDGTVESLDGHVGDMIRVGAPLLHIRVVDTSTKSKHSNNNNNNKSSSAAPTPAETSPPKTLHNVDDEQDKLHIPSLASKYELEMDRPKTAPTSSNKVLATPAVRKLGMEHDLDLSNIVGTGPKGRVLKADVLQLIANQDGSYIREEKPETSPVGGGAATAAPAGMPTTTPFLLQQDTTIDIKGYNRAMVKSMTASLQVPHMHYGDEVNMNEMIKCRASLQPLAASRYNIKLSLLPFALKAVSLALREYPMLNATLNVEQSQITYRASHNIGVAMDTPRGLAVPVVKDCQTLSVLEIAAELDRLKQLAMASNLSESDISGATFSMSNMGPIGGTYMSPVVVPPQVAIGAMGRIQRLPRFVGDSDNDEIEPVHVMQISWGGDHRVMDGATLARFSNQWKDYMENPMTMMLSMK